MTRLGTTGMVVVGTLLLGGCDSPEMSPQASDSSAHEESTTDADSCSRVRGEAPFAATFDGPLIAESGPVLQRRPIALWFPSGLRANQPVLLTRAEVFGTTSVHKTTLDASLRAHWAFAAGGCGESLDATLHDGLVDVSAVINATGNSDYLMPKNVRGTFCATGAPPPLEPRVAGASVIDPARLTFNAPIGGSSTVAATRNMMPLEDERITFSTFEISVGFTVKGLGDSPITIDLSNVRDTVGRRLAGAVSAPVYNPTTTITDRTFATKPPATSFVGDLNVTDGVLEVAWGGAILAFEGEGSHLRIRSRLRCGPITTTSTTATVISSEGLRIKTTPKCSADFEDEVVALSGTGPYRMAISVPAQVFPPCTGPGVSSPGDTYYLDELIFEP